MYLCVLGFRHPCVYTERKKETDRVRYEITYMKASTIQEVLHKYQFPFFFLMQLGGIKKVKKRRSEGRGRGKE